ncbi:MAG: helix-turn-helix domain-containing protein, partial [Candidatus Moranbacteria bacterium]|nr:helix-turn-helix domain-containing protein [Candidatus Moranbacteria bacterium]
MLEKDLQEIGLNEKEARVYLSALELGQSTVQDIAKKALVNRATTYFVIESLMKSGLMSSFQKGKKQYFVAADPDRL